MHDGVSKLLSPIAIALPGSVKNVYFWVSIPVGQWAGTYTNTIFVKAVKDGNTP